MALLHMESFDNTALISANEGTYVVNIPSLVTGYGGIGFAARMPDNIYYRHTPGTPAANGEYRTIAYAVKPDATVSSSFPLPGFSESDSVIADLYSDFYLTWNMDGSVKVTYAPGTSYTTPAGVMPQDGWSWVSMTCERSTTATWSVSINGVEVASSAVQGTGNTTGEAWQYFLAKGQGSGRYIFFDDLIITDQFETIPPTKVLDLAPTSTSTGQWTGSDGNSVDNHLLVGDPADTATYVEASSAGLTDLYGFSPGLSTDPMAMQFFAQCRYDGIGGGTMDTVVSSGGTEATTSIVPVDAWATYKTQLNTDPNTGSPWTAAAANAALFGVRTT